MFATVHWLEASFRQIQPQNTLWFPTPQGPPTTGGAFWMRAGFAAAWSSTTSSCSQALGQLVGEIMVCILFLPSPCEEPAVVLMVCSASCQKGVCDPCQCPRQRGQHQSGPGWW